MNGKARWFVTALVTILALGAGAQAAAAWELSPPWAGAMAGKPVPGYDSAPGGPKGYVVVESGTVTDWAGGQTHDEIVCPAGKVPLGGGAQLYSSSLGENLASSYPTTQGWAVDVNNATTADGLYDIYAVCANPPENYFVYGYGPFPSHAWHGGAADDGCGRNMKVLGGGIRTHTTDTSVNIQQDYPLPEGLGGWAPGYWQVEMTNPTARDLNFDEYVICGKIKHTYQVVKGTTSVDRAGTREQVNTYCPTGTRPLGGGVQTMTADTGVTLNSTFPWPTGWSGIENNTGTTDPEFSVSVVCE
jgi:hypothetical protein